MENKRLININLYGDGSRDSKLRAEAVYCDRCEECSLYKRGLCCKITCIFSPYCPIGTINAYGYYTKQAKAYRKLYTETQSNEMYNKLKYPSDFCVETVGVDVMIRLSYANIKVENNELKITDQNLFSASNIVVLPAVMLTDDNIKKICEYRPRSFFNDNVISEYKTVVVPRFIDDLRKKLPAIFNRFIKHYPEFDIAPNYVGRSAKLATVNKDLVYTIDKGKFTFESDDGTNWYIVFPEYRSVFLPFNGKVCYLKLPVTDDMKIKITDNSQVTEETIFI